MRVHLLVRLFPSVSEVFHAGVVVARVVLSRWLELSLGAHFNGERVVSVVIVDVNLIGPWIFVSNIVLAWIDSIEHVSWLDHHGARLVLLAHVLVGLVPRRFVVAWHGPFSAIATCAVDVVGGSINEGLFIFNEIDVDAIVIHHK